VICAVYGPRPKNKPQYTEHGKLFCDYKVAPFGSSARKKVLQTDSEREYSTVMEHALQGSVRLDMYPKAQIDVLIFVLESDGSSLAAAITCASLALADAGIEMVDLVPCCALGCVDGKLLLDPVDAEERIQSGGLIYAYMPNLKQIAHVMQSGLLSQALSSQAIDICDDACLQVSRLMREALRKSMHKK